MNTIKFSGRIIRKYHVSGAIIFALIGEHDETIDAVKFNETESQFCDGERVLVTGSLGNYDSGEPCIKIESMEKES